MTTAQYEVYAIKYAHHARTAKENFIGGDPHDGPMPMDYFVWLIRGEGREIVVDTGFNVAVAAKRAPRASRCPWSRGSRCMGVDAAGSEGRRDHAPALRPRRQFRPVPGGDLPPAGPRDAVRHRPLHDGGGDVRHAYEVEDVVGMVRRVYAGRVRFHDGDGEIAPGVTAAPRRRPHHGPAGRARRHAPRLGGARLGCQPLLRQHGAGRGRFPIVYNVGDMVEGWRGCSALADSPAHVIPGHDPLVLERYPGAAPGAAGHRRAPGLRLDTHDSLTLAAAGGLTSSSFPLAQNLQRNE